MDMNLIKGLIGDQDLGGAVFETVTTEYQIFRDNSGDIAVTNIPDTRLETVWKDCEMLCIISSEQKAYYDMRVQEINNKWDKKISVDSDFNITEVERYTPEEKTEIEEQRNQQYSDSFITSERSIALKIEEDYRLELEEISDIQMKEVKQYIKSLQTNSLMRALDRPELMFIYEKRINGGV